VEDFKGLIDYLKIDTVNLAGWSLGGMILQNLVLKYPERVHKIALINTFPGFPNEQGIEMFKQSKIEKSRELINDPAKAFFEGIITSWTRKNRKLMEKDSKKVFHGLFSAEDLIKMQSTDPPRPQDIINQAVALAEHSTEERLHEIKNEALVLCAENDRLAPVLSSQKIHEKLPNSTLKIIKNSGHDSPLESAPEVNQILIDFFSD